MRVDWSDSFDRFLSALEEDVEKLDPSTPEGRIAVERLAHLGALLGKLRELPTKPAVESATLRIVRQATRHELWRVAHPFDADVALRIIVWFPQVDQAVLAVFAFDKAHLGDVWYDRAAVEGQALVDQWLREHGG